MLLILSNSVPSPSQSLLFMEYKELFVYSKQKLNQKSKRKNTLCLSPEELTAHTIPSISLQYLCFFFCIFYFRHESWYTKFDYPLLFLSISLAPLVLLLEDPYYQCLHRAIILQELTLFTLSTVPILQSPLSFLHSFSRTLVLLLVLLCCGGLL